MTLYNVIACPILKSDNPNVPSGPFLESLMRYHVLADNSSTALQKMAADLKQRVHDKLPENTTCASVEVLQFERGISDTDNEQTVILR